MIRFYKYGLLVLISIIVLTFVIWPVKDTGTDKALDPEEEFIFIRDPKVLYWNTFEQSLVEIGDKDLTAFGLLVIPDICPFYEPDGANYRECLNNLVQKKKIGNQQSTIREAERYCDEITTGYFSLDKSELFLICVSHKLSKLD